MLQKMTSSRPLFSAVRPLRFHQLTSGIYIKGATSESHIEEFGTSAVLSGVDLSLPPGPYFMSNSGGSLSFYKAFRLYSDTQRVHGVEL
jgi:hypothetical protein